MPGDASRADQQPDGYSDRDEFSITELAEEFGVTHRTLRFYEDEGLIAPRRSGLARIYGKRDRTRLAWILRGKRVGFSLAEIREMIDLYDKDDDRQERRRVTRMKCVERIALLKRQREDIDVTLGVLEAFVLSLDDVQG